MFKKYFPILEKRFIKMVVRKRGSTLLYLLVLLVIFSLYFIPYLNLYINNKLIGFLIISGLLIVFRISIQRIAYLAILLFFISMVLFLLNDYDRAELLVDMVYGLVFTGIISNLPKLRDKS